jgi:hypothetical protein
MEHRPEVADVIRSHGGRYVDEYGASKEQRQVLRALGVCRTRALGGHKKKCNRCGFVEVSYNSCRNRHCPKCQAKARSEWLIERQKELLDVPYFHVVFTLPDKLGPLALQNKRLVYRVFFRSVSETLRTIAKDPKHLGAEIGFLTILHTWGQNLLLHPHIHCVVPGGGISLDGQRWIACRDEFFLHVVVLSRLFRGKFLAYLQDGFDQGQIQFHGRLTNLADRACWRDWIRELRAREWVVYVKPPFGGPQQVLKYLARYTHRVAVSNSRLVAFEDGKVTFRYKDYAQGSRQRTMTVDAEEFIRRFLLHVLPKGFVRIRYYGFLANHEKWNHLEKVRNLLEEDSTFMAEGANPSPADTSAQGLCLSGTDDLDLCPVCRKGFMVQIEEVKPIASSFLEHLFFDTS